MNHNDKPKVLAAPAPGVDEGDDVELTPQELQQLAADEQLFDAYGAWCRTRSFFGPPPVSGSVLGRLTSKSRVKRSGPPDAACSAQMSALHLAVIAQPSDGLDRKVFTLHYVYGVRNVKAAADALGISRQHWYRLLKAFRVRVHGAAASIMSDNVAAAASLPSQGGARLIADDSD